MIPAQSRLLTRLALGSALSAALHLLLLLAFNPMQGNGQDGARADAWNALTVRLTPMQRGKEETLVLDKPRAQRHFTRVSQEPAAPSPTAQSAPITNTWHGWLGNARPQPRIETQYQVTADYQQMEAIHAQLLAREQRQFAISRLQIDIEQKLNQQGVRVTGHCSRKKPSANDAAILDCNPPALADFVHVEMQSFSALNDALRGQGRVLDGLTVSLQDGRSVIEYHTHPAQQEAH